MGTYYITIIGIIITSFLAQITGNKKRANNHILFVFLTGAILSIVAGLRWQVGTDYAQYSRNYNKYILEIWNDIKNFNEPGINFISKISSLIFDDYATMFFIASLITIGLIVMTISKYSNMFTFSILLFIFIGAWHGSFNGVRQYLAVAIIFSGHRYVINRELKKYLLIIFIASLFHISAVSMLLVYFIPLKKMKFKELFILFLFTMIFLVSYDFAFQLLGDLFEVSGDTAYAQREVNSLRIMVQVAPILLYLFLNKKTLMDKENSFYTNMIFINAFLWIATSGSAYLSRLPLYTMIFLPLSYPKMVNFKDYKLRIALKSVILLLYFVFWYIEVSGSNSLNDFKWIFER